MNPPRIVTLGAHGCAESRFFNALAGARVDTFCDLRLRRGMRGPDYAFANSARLQQRLARWVYAIGTSRNWRPAPAPAGASAKTMSVTEWRNPPDSANARKQSPRLVWTADEDEALLRYFEAGVPLDVIASSLGRGVFSVRVRLDEFGIAPSSPPGRVRAAPLPSCVEGTGIAKVTEEGVPEVPVNETSVLVRLFRKLGAITGLTRGG